MRRGSKTVRVRRDSLTKKRALADARLLLPKALAGDRGAAEVLVDLATYAGHEDIGEDLLLALQGREFRLPHRGVPLQYATGRQRHITTALEYFRHALFPPRSRPCMPNAAELARLVRENSDDPRSELRVLRRYLEAACRSPSRRNIEEAMDVADRILQGSGVETATVGTRTEGDLRFSFVNFGDTYVTTLIYDNHADRFRITSYGDMVETWERRYGQEDITAW